MTSAALLGAAFACGPQPVSRNQDGEIIDQQKSGIIRLDNVPNGMTLSQRVTTTFIDAASDTRCTVKENGPCRLIECPDLRRSGPFSSAGNIAVTDMAAGVSVQMVFGTPSMGYAGNSATNSGLLFNPGETLVVKASGGAVPAFTSSVVGPASIIVTAPMEPTLSIDRSKDLAVTWVGTPAQKVVFQLKAQASNYPLFECRFDGKGQAGTIPSAALQMLSQGAYIADAFSRSRVISEAGDWPVQLDADYYAGKDGNAYKRSANVQ